MTTKSLGGGYKVKIDKSGKATVVKDRKAQLAKMDASTGAKAMGSDAKKVRYGKRGLA